MSRNVSEIVRKHTFGTWRPQKGWVPLHITKAQGSHFWDASGKRYLDMSAQLMCSNIGHGNTVIADAIAKQARELAFVAPGFATDVRADLALKLLEVVPKGIEKFFFATSGTEANECALKIARMKTGKHKVIARYQSYHGSTASSVACTGDYRRWFAETSASSSGNIIHVPECNPYRPNIAGLQSPLASLDYIEYVLQHEQHVGAVIVEPIVGTNGVLVPPPEYFPRLRALTQAHGALLIADEVMSGFGRTGKWFAIQHWDVTPDILVFAKGVTSAYTPLGCVGVTREVADYFEDGWFCHGHTYESHPVVLAAAVACVSEMQRLDLPARAAKTGEYLGAQLRKLAAKHPSVGDVRGVGLFWCVELVQDAVSKEPFNTYKDKAARKPLLIDQVAADLMKRGVYCVGWISHFVLAPPLIITEAEVDEAIAALDASLTIADAAIARKH